MRPRVATSVLEWILDKAPSELSGDLPWLVQEVTADGTVIWLGLEERNGEEGRLVKYVPHSIPPTNISRALTLHDFLTESDGKFDGGVIGFASDGSKNLSWYSDWMGEGRIFGERGTRSGRGVGGVVPGRFKKRPRK